MHAITLVWLLGALGFVLVQGFVEWGTVFDGAAVAFAAAWFIIGLGIMGWLFTTTRRYERQLLADGTPGQATMESVRHTIEVQGIRTRYLVVWGGLAFIVLSMLVALAPNAFDVIDFAKDLLGQ